MRHGVATFAAFVTAGTVPLVPFLFRLTDGQRFFASIVLTLATLFAAGLMRAYVTGESRRASVVEMLGLGATVAAVAYYAGRIVASLGGMR